MDKKILSVPFADMNICQSPRTTNRVARHTLFVRAVVSSSVSTTIPKDTPIPTTGNIGLTKVFHILIPRNGLQTGTFAR